MSIAVQNIVKTYGSQRALDNVSFEIGTGEIVGFLGPNGAGKSTLMKILTCFIPQTEGKANICSFDVKEQSMNVRKNVGYLPENNPLYLDMYVKEYLSFIAGLHKIKNKKEKVADMIETVGLQAEQKKKIGALSKGYRQRVGLAQALIHDPNVLILDEPTSGLDPNQIVEIRNLIKGIGKEKTVMMSTHIMQEVEAICDRVIIINKGKIVADDTAKAIRSATKGKEVVIVEFSGKVDETKLKKIEGIESATNAIGNIWHVQISKDVRNEIFQFAVQNELSVLAMQREEQRLEDVFKELTAE
ncbi:MAG: gliding motility-associated ABC transporter ATP-binding subunit GldA [Flavobacteriales bacterium]|nr:MAG: gliding motility-associated ABC transporter ATP-binding subunit GldA [Flavobacteriales bacterium]